MTEAKTYAEFPRKGYEDFREFVNPLIAQRALLAGEPVHVVSSDAGRMVDVRGHVIEDMHGAQAFGHRHPTITAAAQAFLETDYLSWYPSRVNPYVGHFARRLSERTGYDKVYFGLSGSEAVEAALKMARAITRRPGLLSLRGAYHGCTYGSCALMTSGPFRDPFGPHLPGARPLPLNDIDALDEALSGGDVACIVVEPIQVEGGVRALSDAYVEALCELTTRHGVVLVADEIQTGLGRTGRGFLATSTWPRRPDAVLLGKSLGGGLMPVSAMLTGGAFFEQAYGENFATAESHNSTFGPNSLGMVTGLATLDLLSDAQIAHVAEVGALFRDRLREALGEMPLFDEVRGEGFLLGLVMRELDHPWLSYEHFGMSELEGQPLIAPLLCHRLYRRGYFCFSCGHDWRIIRLQPRLNITLAELDAFVEACRDELGKLCDLI